MSMVSVRASVSVQRLLTVLMTAELPFSSAMAIGVARDAVQGGHAHLQFGECAAHHVGVDQRNAECRGDGEGGGRVEAARFAGHGGADRAGRDTTRAP